MDIALYIHVSERVVLGAISKAHVLGNKANIVIMIPRYT